MIRTKIIKIKDLLLNSDLDIPEYQRPYKWTVKNVHQLLDDILLYKDKSAYRLGTIVLHEEIVDGKKVCHIVDGQQRTITLLLIAHALSMDEQIDKSMKKEKMELLEPDLLNSIQFGDVNTKNNIRANYREISRRIKEFYDEENKAVTFFYDSCEVVQVVLDDITEAFQFFDSQNARGKDLYPHDLLKAFHLREMQSNSIEMERAHTVESWENVDTEEVSLLFADYLYRIRNWSKGNSARIFSKNETNLFQGISPNIKETFPYAHMSRISHYFVEKYNSNIDRHIDTSSMEFPHQLDQLMINGKRFFEWVEHYRKITIQLRNGEMLFELPHEVFAVLDKYSGRRRDGDKYVRNLFNCALLYYIDKFGMIKIDRAIETFFLWAYSLRLNLQSVQLASVDNHALSEPFIFKRIRDSLKPEEVFAFKIEPPDIRFRSNVKDIIDLFEEYGYA